MSSTLSIIAIVLSVVSVSLTGGSWLIQWKQWLRSRQPKLDAIFEDYGDPDIAFLELTNMGDEDLVRVEIELRETLEGIIPALRALFIDQVRGTGQTKRVTIGSLEVLQTKRVRALRDRDVEDGKILYTGGDANLYAHCIGRHWWLKWRIPLTVNIPMAERDFGR